MLIGFEGTAGSLGSLAGAIGGLWQDRARRVWSALNEPIPFARAINSPAATAAGMFATTIANMAPPTSAGLAMRAASGAIGVATRAGVGSMQAIGSQVAKTGAAFGHGSAADIEYADAAVQGQIKALAKFGFINQLVKSYASVGRSVYMPGPTTLGSQDPSIVAEGVAKVVGQRARDEELIVAGYSRGGLNAINACNELAARGQEIQLLILFDPVDRDTSLGHCNVSAAVRNCILVQRTSATFVWKPYMRKVSVGSLDFSIPDVWLTTSRWNFGRMVDDTDRKTLTHGALMPAQTDATHAAFGGVPWTGDNPPYMNQGADRQAAAAIAAFVNGAAASLRAGWSPALRLMQPAVPD